MNNIEIIEVENKLDGSITEHVIIDRGNGEYTSMMPLPTESVEARLRMVGEELGEVNVVTAEVRYVERSC